MRRTSSALTCLLAIASSATALARPPVERPDNLLDDRFEMGAEFALTSNDTTLRVDPTTGIPGLTGTQVNAEQDLGLPSRKLVGSLDILLRPAPRHAIRLNYLFLPLDRSATAPLSKDVQFKDSAYLAGDVVGTELDIHMEGLRYGYSVLRGEAFDVAVGVGAQVIQANAQASVPARLALQQKSTSAPVPLLGFDGTYRISSRWYVQGDLESMHATLNHIYGNVTLWHLGALYRLNPNVTFGLGFRSYHVTVDSHKSGETGLFSIRSSGPSLSARVGF